MSLPPAAPSRQLKHRRQIDVQVFARGNGLWEVDALLIDTKTRVANMAEGPRPAGTPIHDMLLRLVVNEKLDILEAGSETRWMPYTGVCNQHGDPQGDAYGRLVGLNLLQDFRKRLRERLGGIQGCTHITELAQVLPTAVVQAFAGEVIDTRGLSDGASRPFQIDRCHALRSDGEVVRLHHPRWYHAPETATSADLTQSRFERASEEPR
ncbi:MAG: DUF2889 domain-containing protein [Rubrivivax sp.]|nr:DUF2889 domain-containing protein [Rubrivivax sp.]MDP3614307.1 DUF2889 domain-containing protein [Rubrivivax sp.]